MAEDIREKSFAGPEDILGLNFIRGEIPFFFRRYYRQGLRSHVMEVLDPEDLALERSGVLSDRVRTFPRARPIKMFRVFRKRFKTLEQAREEVLRVKLVEKYLGPEYIAHSEEILVDYMLGDKRHLLLCGLQDYVEGEALDPWSPVQEGLLWEMASRFAPVDPENALGLFLKNAEEFLRRMKRLIKEAGLIPDLAGINNLIITSSGPIRLVDINNISPINLAPDIPVDDKGYPICDKSIQALSLLEKKLLGRDPDMTDPLFQAFLDPERIRNVQVIESAFRGRP